MQKWIVPKVLLFIYLYLFKFFFIFFLSIPTAEKKTDISFNSSRTLVAPFLFLFHFFFISIVFFSSPTFIFCIFVQRISAFGKKNKFKSIKTLIKWYVYCEKMFYYWASTWPEKKSIIIFVWKERTRPFISLCAVCYGENVFWLIVFMALVPIKKEKKIKEEFEDEEEKKIMWIKNLCNTSSLPLFQH